MGSGIGGGARRVLPGIALAVGLACFGTGVAGQESMYAAHGVDVRITPALELLGVVHLLGESRFATTLEVPYVEAVRDHFGHLAGHEAVSGLSEVMTSGLSLEEVLGALATASPLEEGPRAGSEGAAADAPDAVKAYLPSLQEFARLGDFESFWRTSAETRERILQHEAPHLLGGAASLGLLLGSDLNATLHLSPLFVAGSVAWTTPIPDGDEELHLLLGPLSGEGGLPDFGGPDRVDADFLSRLARGPVAEVVAADSDAVAEYEELFELIRFPMGQRGRDRWQGAWAEHVVQGLVVNTLERVGRDSVAAAHRTRLERDGFAYLPTILDGLPAPGGDGEGGLSLSSLHRRLLSGLDADLRLQESVVVDPRIELMTVVQALAGWWLLARHDTPYKRDLYAYFHDHRDHPAVRAYADMSRQGFGFDAVPRFFALLSSPPDIRLAADIPEELARRGGGEKRLREFVRLLQLFVRDSDFQSFVEAHEGTYRTILLSARRSAGEAAGVLWRYTGQAGGDWRVILGPMLHDGGFASDDIRGAPHAFLGPTGVRSGVADFGDPERIGPLVWHEFAHTVINPTTELYADEVARLDFAHEPIRRDMAEQAYATWNTVVNEHFVRAVEIRITQAEVGPQAARELLDAYVEIGFRYLPPLLDALEEYEAARDSYPTIRDFYPRLLERLESAARDGDAMGREALRRARPLLDMG